MNSSFHRELGTYSISNTVSLRLMTKCIIHKKKIKISLILISTFIHLREHYNLSDDSF